MEKETSINLFISLLLGNEIAGRAESFYKVNIDKEWRREILDTLVLHGQIGKIQLWQQFDPDVKLQPVDIRNIIQINLQKNNFLRAFSAASHFPPDKRDEESRQILAKGLAYYIEHQDEENVKQHTRMLCQNYHSRYPIPGWAVGRPPSGGDRDS